MSWDIEHVTVMQGTTVAKPALPLSQTITVLSRICRGACLPAGTLQPHMAVARPLSSLRHVYRDIRKERNP
jgi:hypothetical protein